MRVSREYPPNIDQIRKYVDLGDKALFMTFGDTLYNPSGVEVSEHIMVHERKHSVQQLEYPGGPEAFCDRYFTDRKFRLDMEAEAYQAQYAFLCSVVPDRNSRASILSKLALDLASPLYDAGITQSEARELIRNNIH